MVKGKVYSISVSHERGQLKKEIPEALFIENYGIDGDGHVGDWGRQVTCLDKRSVDRANREHQLGAGPGDFAENVLLDGLDLSGAAPGSRLKLGSDVILEVTQIGKEDHPSVVTKAFGVSLLPYEGLFCRVVKGGTVKKGDSAELL
jgi:MOSC domain-containing protein YiiM